MEDGGKAVNFNELLSGGASLENCLNFAKSWRLSVGESCFSDPVRIVKGIKATRAFTTFASGLSDWFQQIVPA